MASAMETESEEKEANVRLIELVTDQPALWDTTSPQYRDKGYKKAVIGELAQQMNWTENAVLKRFANLRTYYTKELNKELLSQMRCDGDSDEIFRSKWPYYHLLDKFLRTQVRTAKKVHSKLENVTSPSIMRVNFDTDSIEHILEDEDQSQLDSPDGIHGNNFADWEDEPVPRKLVKHEPTSPCQPCQSELSVKELTRKLIKHEPSSPCQPELSIREPTNQATFPNQATSFHLATPTSTVSSQMLPTESSDEIFAKLISHQLKRVNEGKKKELLKIKIQQLIVEALFDD